MICKVLALPFRLVMHIPGAVLGIVKMALSAVAGLVSFVISHVTGTVMGALVGFLLGRKHVGIRTASKKKNK